MLLTWGPHKMELWVIQEAHYRRKTQVRRLVFMELRPPDFLASPYRVPWVGIIVVQTKSVKFPA